VPSIGSKTSAISVSQGQADGLVIPRLGLELFDVLGYIIVSSDTVEGAEQEPFGSMNVASDGGRAEAIVEQVLTSFSERCIKRLTLLVDPTLLA